MLGRAKTAVFANGCFCQKCKLLQQQSSSSASGNMRLSGQLKKKAQKGKVALHSQKRMQWRQPSHSIVFLIYKSVCRNTVVPLPVCSGADWCAISALLKPYLCNWSLRVCLTCDWSRFQLCNPLSLRCPSRKTFVHYQGLNVIWFLLECLTVSPCFLLLVRRGSLSLLAWKEPLITFSF